MTMIPADVFYKHQVPMLMAHRDNMKTGTPVFLGIVEEKDSTGVSSMKYIMRHNMFVDNHLGYGIDELVSVGMVSETHTRSISAIGVWEIGKAVENGRVEIKPTWDYTKEQLRDLLAKAGLGDEAEAIHLTYKNLKQDIKDSARLAA